MNLNPANMAQGWDFSQIQSTILYHSGKGSIVCDDKSSPTTRFHYGYHKTHSQLSLDRTQIF